MLLRVLSGELSSDTREREGEVGVPAVFVREHDAILLALPFAFVEARLFMTSAHREGLAQAVQRHFVRSMRMVGEDAVRTALERSCTEELGYRLAEEAVLEFVEEGEAVLLTCLPHAHLALANFLERDALFTVEMIGRVVRRQSEML